MSRAALFRNGPGPKVPATIIPVAIQFALSIPEP